MARFKRSRSGSKTTLLFILLLILAGGLGTAFFLFFEGESPQIAIDEPSEYLGQDGIISVSATDAKSGLRQIALRITQGSLVKELYREQFARNGLTGAVGMPEKQLKTAFQPEQDGFKDGPAEIVLEAWDHSFRGLFKGNRSVLAKEVIIDTTPPKLSILHSERYINPGGSGIVIYRSVDPDLQSGVQIDEKLHPGFTVGDGRDDTYISYFALPYSATGLDKSFVVAKDPAGNETTLPFSVIFKDKQFKQDKIDVGDGFLEKKIPEFMQYYPEMQGEMVDKYLYTNNEVRDLNNSKISELCNSPHPQRLWEGRFQRMAGSTRAGFADHRTYYYDAKPIDKQVHLGIDIASTRQADVKAAEKGIVVYADYLGIYGNMVMLDHGQGVFSLYSHMSQINVSVGDTIEKDVVIGTTGTTGMAGGDHLHFSMLINGIFVTPLEWWDQHWIDVTIEEPFTESRFQ